jgi:hypothetical protein
MTLMTGLDASGIGWNWIQGRVGGENKDEEMVLRTTSCNFLFYIFVLTYNIL